MNYLKKRYRIPTNILKHIKSVIEQYDGDKKTKGYLFSLNLLERGNITGHQLKKFKADFDEIDDNDIEYILSGGQLMLDWVNQILGQVRNQIEKRKELTSNAGLSNRYRKTHSKNVSPILESLIIFFS